LMFVKSIWQILIQSGKLSSHLLSELIQTFK
jgi:hypothetical protein